MTRARGGLPGPRKLRGAARSGRRVGLSSDLPHQRDQLGDPEGFPQHAERAGLEELFLGVTAGVTRQEPAAHRGV